jgi:hypothetical protein
MEKAMMADFSKVPAYSLRGFLYPSEAFYFTGENRFNAMWGHNARELHGFMQDSVDSMR